MKWPWRKAPERFATFEEVFGEELDLVSKPRQVVRDNEEANQKKGFRPTEDYGSEGAGIYLGTAMAISGAAASPNMGYHSSTALAFLMTVFNVRLGWWLGNPLEARWKRPGPRWGLAYLLAELFGLTSAERSYVYLSDGGILRIWGSTNWCGGGAD